MNFTPRALLLTVGCLLFLTLPTQGAGKYLEIEYPPSTAANMLQIGVTYTMWIPDGVPRFRCVIVHQHGPVETSRVDDRAMGPLGTFGRRDLV
jgi:hypothetical protein